MNLVDSKINSYCELHSTGPSKECSEIEDFTIQNVPLSVMLVGPLEGSFLGFLVSLLHCKRVLEIGCFTGYSALAMAERLPHDGKLITIDHNRETSLLARNFWKKSPHGEKITLVEGDALSVLTDILGPFDLIFLDATKSEYRQYFEKCLPLLSPNGLIVADNCLREGDVLKEHPDPGTQSIKEFNSYLIHRTDLECVLLPVRDGIYLIKNKNKSF